MMNNEVTIFTNGKQLFTLENFSKSAGVCEAHNISIHSTVSKLKARAMHSNGQLHYVFGTSDRKVLNGDNKLYRGVELEGYSVR